MGPIGPIRPMNIRKGDNVKIIAGSQLGREGKVLQVLTAAKRVVVEGLNMRRRHQRPRKAGEKGQILNLPAPIHVSNVMLVCSKCGQPGRAAKKILPDGTRSRFCRKCKEMI